LGCAKKPRHCGHVEYKVARHVACDCHTTQETYDEKGISSQDPQEGSFQTSHSQISSGHSNPLDMPTEIIPLFSSSMERHRKPCLLHGNLFVMPTPSSKCLSSM